jgi:hypothetical protein
MGALPRNACLLTNGFAGKQLKDGGMFGLIFRKRALSNWVSIIIQWFMLMSRLCPLCLTLSQSLGSYLPPRGKFEHFICDQYNITAAVELAIYQGTVSLVSISYRRSFITSSPSITEVFELARPGFVCNLLWLPLLFPDHNIGYSPWNVLGQFSPICKARASDLRSSFNRRF